MAEHPTLETRLRTAFGAGSGGLRTDPDSARARVVAGIRRRRARRLRAAGGAVAAIAALGIALPLVLDSGGASPGSQASRSAAALGRSPTSTPPRFGLLAPAAVPGAHTRSTPASTGRCLVATASVTPCGDLVAAPGAGQRSATKSTAEFGAAAAPAPAPATLHVRLGGLFEVTLPRLTGRRTWSTPRLAGTFHGTGTPLEVRRSPRTRVPRAGWQGFVVRATAAGTFELDAHAPAPAPTQGLPSGARSRATWTLGVEVTGK